MNYSKIVVNFNSIREMKNSDISSEFFIIHEFKLLFFSSEEESSHTKDTEYDQEHSTDHIAKDIETENQKDDTDDSENLFFSRRYFSSISDLASNFLAFFTKSCFCFMFDISCKWLYFGFHWAHCPLCLSYSFFNRFFSWHYAYM